MCSKCVTAYPSTSFLAWRLHFPNVRALSCFATNIVSVRGLDLYLGLDLAPQGLYVASASWYRWMGGHVLSLNSTPPPSNSVINGLLVDKSPWRLRRRGAARQTMAARQSMPQVFSFIPSSQRCFSSEYGCFTFINFNFRALFLSSFASRYTMLYLKLTSYR